MNIFNNYENLPGEKIRRKLKIYSGEIQYTNLDSEELDSKITKPIWPFLLITLCSVFLLIFQLLKLQISEGGFNKILADTNRLRKKVIEAPRGIIYDRNNKQLVVNEVSYQIEIAPYYLPKNKEEKELLFVNLSSIIQMPSEKIKELSESKKRTKSNTVIIKENIDRDTAMLLKVETNNFPGISITTKPIRNYKEITGLSPIIGYVGKLTEEEIKNKVENRILSEIGKDGIEKIYQNYLKGQDGNSEFEVDSIGREQRLVSNTLPKPGNSVVLTINSDLEAVIAENLQQELIATQTTAGSVIAIDPRNGEVLGAVSLPTYNNNLFSRGISTEDYAKLADDPTNPLFNRSISGTYSSGSTIKPFIAASALQEGNITQNTTILDEGKIEVNGYVYPDWKTHGLVNVTKAISESCNIFFYALGGGWDKIQGLGIEKINDYLNKFGFGEKTGIDLPGEAKGLIPNPEWKEENKKEQWYLGDTYHISIGQGDFLVTPIQMASALSVIANNGILYKPHVVSKIKNSDSEIVLENKPEIIKKDFISQENINIVRQGMREAVIYGSARQFSDLPVTVGAKTGTTQFGDKSKTHSWMIAFAPYNDPEIAIVAIIEGGGEGHAAAGPVIKDVLNWYFSGR